MCLLFHTAGNVCNATQQTCLLCHTSGMTCPAQQDAPHSRQLCCAAHEGRMLHHTQGISAASRNEHGISDESAVSCCRPACCVAQQACLLYLTARKPAMSHSRRDMSDMSALRHARHMTPHHFHRTPRLADHRDSFLGTRIKKKRWVPIYL